MASSRRTVRGRVKVVGLADGPILWLLCRSGKGRARILTGDLVKAVRTESVVAVAHAWNVSGQAVSVWRRRTGRAIRAVCEVGFTREKAYRRSRH